MRFLLFAVLSSVSLPAIAQDGGVLLPAAEPDVANIAAQVLDGIQNKNWWLVAGAAVILVVWVMRTQVIKVWPKLGEFLQHPVVSVLLPILVAAGGGLATAAAAGPVNGTVVLGILMAALKVGFTGISGYVAAKKIAEAKEDGAAAAGEVKTIGDAKAVFSEPPKGPNP